MACLSSVAHKVIGLAACGFLVLNPHAGLVCGARAEGGHKPGSNLIRVWSLASIYNDALPQTVVPPILERQAEKLGYTITVENLRAAEFASKFRQAVQHRTEPEILTFQDFGVLVGARAFGHAGVESLVDLDHQIASSLVMVYEAMAPLQPHGWVILVRSSANFEAAKALAMQAPVCPEIGSTAHLSTTAELLRARKKATEAARAYLACNLGSLAAVSDKSRFVNKCFLPEDYSQINAVRPCGVSGNHNLALVSLVSTFNAQTGVPAPTNNLDYPRWLTYTALGHQSLLAILRNHRGRWRLLAITDDRTNTNSVTQRTIQRLGSLLNNEPAEPVAPESARLITPDGARLTHTPDRQFDNFIWRPSPSADVVCEVAEFSVGVKSSVQDRTSLYFLFDGEGRLSSGSLAGNSGRWRVWSVSRSGNVSFSEQRSFPFEVPLVVSFSLTPQAGSYSPRSGGMSLAVGFNPRKQDEIGARRVSDA
jgi:hypothetical protein